MKAIDLTGQRFGRLVVLCRAEGKNGRSYWLCRCDCGKDCVVQGQLLRNGHTKSCGCLQTENRLGEDLTGKRYGRLTVLSLVSVKNRDSLWLCRCDCGKLLEVRRSLLTAGVKSCGCLGIESTMKNIKNTYFAGTNIGRIRSNKPKSNSGTGITGVSYNQHRKKYDARITVNKKTYYLGLFTTLEEATAARRKAEERYFAPIIEKYEGQKND